MDIKLLDCWLHNNFDKVKDGDVVDVEYLLGETDLPKNSERIRG